MILIHSGHIEVDQVGLGLLDLFLWSWRGFVILKPLRWEMKCLQDYKKQASCPKLIYSTIRIEECETAHLEYEKPHRTDFESILYYFQLESLQVVRAQAGVTSEVQPLPSQRAGPELEPSGRFWSDAAEWYSAEFRDFEVSSQSFFFSSSFQLHPRDVIGCIF